MLLQPAFSIQEIDAKCFQSYKLAKKKDKNFKKNKFTNIFLINSFSKKQLFSIYQSNKKS